MMKYEPGKKILAWAIIFLLLLYIYFNNLHLHIFSMPAYWWSFSTLLAWSVMCIGAWIVFLARTGSIPKLKTLVLFPICQNLSGYLFPLQGSLAFSALYFKHAYGLNISRTIGLNVVLATLSVLLAGLTGLIVTYRDETSVTAPIFAAMTIASITFIFLALYLSRKNGATYDRPAELSLFRLPLRIGQELGRQIRSFASQRGVLPLYLLKILLYLLWFEGLNHALATGFTTPQLLYLVFAVEASLIFKLTPGNWGVSQASGGIALALINAPVNEGVLLITTSMLSVLILNLVVGYFATRHFANQFSFGTRKTLYREIAATQEDQRDSS